MIEKMKCEVCKKKKPDVRFEGSVEKHLCDRCLYNIKQKERGMN
jgi:hypothetical protein